jgi:ribosomal protein S18 acetylase RimI-like enzyme
MTCQDWRDAPAAEVDTLYAAERRRWIDELKWDAAASFAIVEQGRRQGAVPGWIARNAAGAIEGWTYYVLHDGALQIGGVTASRPAVARLLLDAVLHSTEADLARRLSCFVFPQGRSIASAFERQRFLTSHSRYLLKSLHPAMPEAAPAVLPAGIRPWREDDLAPTVRLLAASYHGVPGASCFAPDGGLDQWAQYVGQLTRVPACGEFDPALSFVATTPRPTELLGVVMTTRISAESAHVAQVAVAPSARRSGLARQLLVAAFDRAQAAGLNSVTLMVDAANNAAGALYADLGFTERARFLYGSRPARTRQSTVDSRQSAVSVGSLNLQSQSTI